MKNLIEQQQEVVNKINSYMNECTDEGAVVILQRAKERAEKVLDTLEYVQMNY